MNDLDLMDDFRADMPAADPAVLNRARARMFHSASPSRSARSLWVWRVAPAAALAAAAAVAVVAVHGGPPAASPAGPTAAGPVSPDAAHVFKLAAASARKEPVLAARPDQFVYVESLAAWAGGSAGTDGTMTYIPPTEKRRKVWLSVDGSRTGLLKETADKPGKLPVNDNLPLDGGVPAYAKGLPTDPAKMREWLYNGERNKNSPDSRAWTLIGDTLREQYVPPAAIAAMYEAAATIPGTSVVKQVDLAGRHGIAVSRVDRGTRHDIIFDSTTYRFLGERDVVVDAAQARPFPKGAVTGWTAQLKVAIVDQAGQSPS